VGSPVGIFSGGIPCVWKTPVVACLSRGLASGLSHPGGTGAGHVGAATAWGTCGKHTENRFHGDQISHKQMIKKGKTK